MGQKSFPLKNKRRSKEFHKQNASKKVRRVRHRLPKQERIVRTAARNALLDQQVKSINGTD